VTPPSVPNTRFSGTTLACQRDLGNAAVTLAKAWASAVATCQRKQPLDPREPRRDCDSEAARAVEKAQAKAHTAIERCDAELGELPGCAEEGDADAAAECLDAAIGAVAPGYAGVAYP
jgi:hypothetical protein